MRSATTFATSSANTLMAAIMIMVAAATIAFISVTLRFVGAIMVFGAIGVDSFSLRCGSDDS